MIRIGVHALSLSMESINDSIEERDLVFLFRVAFRKDSYIFWRIALASNWKTLFNQR
jgi:hypothetical protein